ncbi:asparagine synthase (glutamine-hydrolyzing) [Knoellia sp. CPCC 206435]
MGLLSPGDRALLDDLEEMSRSVAHRGPDDRGEWVDADAGIALAHRRLAIVDLSPMGHQPMVSADGRWVLVLNGEIYDHRDHRESLVASGRVLRGHSDTEVLLELVASRGVVEALRSVDGMFALALWDRADRVLTLARDRLGEKPLYYGNVGRQFAFSSELTALRRLPRAPAAPSMEAVGAYLELGFVPAPLSILPGVGKLPAGSVLRVRAGQAVGHPEPYWTLNSAVRDAGARRLDEDDDALVERADAMLRRSIRARLMADVPVGAFLSGGVDSSTIAALAQQVSAHPVRTYTVAVGGTGDESSAAAAVAHHLGTEHTTLQLPDLDPLVMSARAIAMHDEPFADPSSIPTALLSAAAREHVTVALSGDGADELLGGYNRYLVGHGPVGRLLSLPRPVRRLGASALRRPSVRSWDRVGARAPRPVPELGTKLHKLGHVLGSADVPGAHAMLARVWQPQEVMADHPARPWGRPVPPPGLSPLESMLWADQVLTLPDDMLVKVDRASMAVGLEVRVPFLDHRFVELSWRLPVRTKVRNGRGKWLLREILGRYVPAELWDRPKVGFDPPLADWLRGPLHEWSHDLLSPAALARGGVLRPEPIGVALAEHDRGERNHDYRLWTALVLQSWLTERGV